MSEPEMLLPVLQQIAERLARIEVFLWSESRYFTCEQMEDALSFEEDETAFRWSCDKCGLAVSFRQQTSPAPGPSCGCADGKRAKKGSRASGLFGRIAAASAGRVQQAYSINRFD